MPYVEYTNSIEQDDLLNRKVEPKPISITNLRINDKVVNEMPSIPTQQSRAVAKKSTAKKQVLPEPTYTASVETKPSHSIVVSQDSISIRTSFMLIKIKGYVNSIIETVIL